MGTVYTLGSSWEKAKNRENFTVRSPKITEYFGMLGFVWTGIDQDFFVSTCSLIHSEVPSLMRKTLLCHVVAGYLYLFKLNNSLSAGLLCSSWYVSRLLQAITNAVLRRGWGIAFAAWWGGKVVTVAFLCFKGRVERGQEGETKLRKQWLNQSEYGGSTKCFTNLSMHFTS